MSIKLFKIDRNSLKSKLILSLTSLIFIIVFLMSFLTAVNTVVMFKKNSKRELAQLLAQSGENLENFLKTQESNIDLWGLQPTIEVFFSNPQLAIITLPGVRSYFHYILTKEKWIENIILIENSKIYYDHSNKLNRTFKEFQIKLLSDFFKSPAQSTFIVNTKEKSYSQKNFLLIKRPFLKNGKNIPGRYIVVVINLQELNNMFFEGVKVGEKGFITLAARSGDKIITSHFTNLNPEINDFTKSAINWKDWENIPDKYRSIVIDRVILDKYKLAVIGVASEKEILVSLYILIFTIIITGTAILVTGFVFTYLISQQITTPIKELIQKVKGVEFNSLEKENFDENNFYYSEIKVLNQAFKDMIDKLIRAREEIFYKNNEVINAKNDIKIEKNRLYTTLSSIGDGVIATSQDTKIIFINHVAENLLECSMDKALGKPLEDLFYIVNELTGTEIKNPVEKALATGKIIELSNYSILVNKNGSKIPISHNAAPVKDEKDNIHGGVLVFRDVSLQRKKEEKLRQSKERFRTIFENNPVSIWLEDFSLVKKTFNNLKEQGVKDLRVYFNEHPEIIYQCQESIKIINVNNAAAKLHKAPSKKDLYENLDKVFTKESYETFKDVLLDLWVGKKEISTDTTLKTFHEKKIFTTVIINLIPGFEDSFSQVLVSVHDITERQNLEQQLRQSQKIESIGRLAGGVAHDYNNMLSVIMGYTEMALEGVDKDSETYLDLKEVYRAAEKSSTITRQLLAFARKQTIAPEIVDLNKMVESMLKMLNRLISEDIVIAWLPKKDGLWPVKVDPSQLDQILANLCVNAQDAISGTGRITIETDITTFDEDYCRSHHQFLPGDYVMIAVSDDGCGMDKTIIDKVFEPFFTTKSLGKGTGLGLSTVYGIVRQNNGFINLYSEPGKGTTFRLYFPRHMGDISKGVEVRQLEIPKGNKEIILVVEDEKSTLDLIERMLIKLNYTPLKAENPAFAVETAKKTGLNISLLLTDVVMPGMNGKELEKEIKNIFPEIKTLFMSGYTANVIANREILEKGINFIQKPFSKNDLAIKIKSVLDS